MREKDYVVVHHVHVGNKFGTRLGNRELGLEPRSSNKKLVARETLVYQLTVVVLRGEGLCPLPEGGTSPLEN